MTMTMTLTQARRAGLLAAELRDAVAMQAALAATTGWVDIRFEIDDEEVGGKHLKLPYDLAVEMMSTARRIIERELEVLGVDFNSMEDAGG